MPIQKEKKYEIAFKNLRHREIPCLVIAVPQKIKGTRYSETRLGCRTYNSQDIASAKILKCLKQRLNRTSKTPTKKSKSLSYLDRKSELSFKVAKKTSSRRKRSKDETSSRKKTFDVSDSTTDVSGNTPVVAAETSKNKTLDVSDPTKDLSGDTQPVSAETSKNKTLDVSDPTKDLSGDTQPVSAETSKNKTLDVSDPTKDLSGDTQPVSAETSKNKTFDVPVSTKDLSGNTDAVVAEASKKETFDVSGSTTDVSGNTTVMAKEPPKKRTYRKKTIKVATITKITGSPVSASKVGFCFGTPVLTPETPKKRVYRKKLKIPAVPHNTPVLCSGSDGDSITSASFLGQSNDSGGQSEVITIIKRGRGRPRLSMPAFSLGSDNGEESTMSQGSDKSSTTRRVRRGLWDIDYDDEDQAEDQVSEYELLRQRNIEENLKKLREIFTEQGLQFEEKASETPKKRKSYSRLPLPPPRPRSQRIEIKRTFMPLDFSGLDEKLTISETVFV